MPELSKATLLEIDNANQPRQGKLAVPVQFNPSSLRLAYSNQSEGGRSAGRQARQHTGMSSVTLTVDLVFDTADEGTTSAPRSVLERTREVEVFIKPQGNAQRHQAPPRVRFHWGDVIVDGVMETLSVDIDHFAHTGTPLRAKAAITIKGQDPERDANRSGAGANTAAPASGLPASPGMADALRAAGLGGGALVAGLGAGLAGSLARGGIGQAISQALGGESLPMMAVRNGLPPEAWRALSGGVSDPSRLPAGREVTVPTAAQAGGGAGSQRGVQAGVPTNTGTATDAAQRTGLSAPAQPTPETMLKRGHALSAAGGVGAALETVKAEADSQGAQQARRAFSGAAGSAVAALTPAASGSVFSLRADPRAQSFGRGVPLRDRVLIAQDERANLLSGQAVLRRAGTTLPPTSSDPGVPGWVALPASAANVSPTLHARGCRCGCGH